MKYGKFVVKGNKAEDQGGPIFTKLGRRGAHQVFRSSGGIELRLSPKTAGKLVERYISPEAE